MALEENSEHHGKVDKMALTSELPKVLMKHHSHLTPTACTVSSFEEYVLAVALTLEREK